MTKQYQTQAARDAQRMGYGGESYWDYLDEHGMRLAAMYLSEQNEEQANRMLTRSIGESLIGNDGD